MTPRTALITGGSRGIGLGIAQALAREGWSLVLVGTRPSSEVASILEALASVAAAAGVSQPRPPGRGSQVAGPVAYLSADLASRDARARLHDELRAIGPIHALVNNAGRAPRVRADILEA